MDTTGATELLTKELSRRKEILVQALVEGAAKDYADYRGMCGEIRGLSQAHAFTTDLLRRMETDDE